MFIYYCAVCSFKSEPDTVMKNQCPDCGRSGLLYVSGTKQEIDDWLQAKCHERRTRVGVRMRRRRGAVRRLRL